MKYYIKDCPHCHEPILLYQHEINCKIYRHAVLKKTLKQIDPHSSKEQCDYYINNDLIYGCGKPFKIEFTEDDDITLMICEYI